MSLYQCPQCGHETATNDTCAGAMKIPPTLYCIHSEGEEEKAVEMKLVTEATIKEDAMVER